MATNSIITKVTGTDTSTNRIASTFYGTCSTAAGTAAKAVTLSDSCVFNDSCLVTGATIHVKFTYSNTHATPTLKVGSATAKQIMKYGTTKAGTTSYTSWYAGAVVSFTYDGIYWQMNDYVEGVDISTKMDKANPTGTGSFSLNRKADTTIGTNSFAEGDNTIASGDYSHAEGFGTIANGNNSHAEGSGSQSSGNQSHAEGYSTAGGNYSHSEGLLTIASSDYQHVGGKFNISDGDGVYAEIIGNGTSANARSNARTLDWSGNEVLSGTIEATGFGTTLLNLIYPVGSIYMSVNNINPGTYLTGTTWEVWGAGRVPVGVDTTQTEFDTVEETGGAKTVKLTSAQSGVPSHAHTYTRPTVSSSGYVKDGITGGSHNHTADVSNSYFWIYRHSGGNTHGALDSGTSAGVGYDLRSGTGSSTHNHNLPNHTHTLTGGGVANNTASDASQAHTNLQPYITCYMWKRVS